MSRRQAKEFADEVSPQSRSLRGVARRMAIRLTARVLWQLTGYRNIEGTETVDAEPFTGIGFYARPSSGDKAEAVLVQIGDARHAVIIACRNEDARRAVINALNGGAGLKENESAMYSRAGLVHIKSNGEIEARTPSGSAVALATKDDVQTLRDEVATFIATKYNTHTHAGVTTGPGTSAVTVALGAPPSQPVGTQKFRAE